MNVLVANRQKESWRNKINKTVTYQYFRDNIKNSLAILTDSISVRSKHKYKHPLTDTLSSYSDIHESTSHAENQPL